MNARSIICPVSFDTIDKNVARVNAVLTAALMAAHVYTGSFLLIAVAVADFAIRVFTVRTRSPLGYLALGVARLLRLKKVPANQGPKLFAWRIGLLFAVTAMALFFVHPTAGAVVALVLAAFALLDGAFDLCVACVIYTHVVLPFAGGEAEGP